MSEIEISRLSVSLTDVLVFVACLWALKALQPLSATRKNLHNYYKIIFGTVGIAALFGAIHHMWLEEATGFLGTLPRFITLISLGYTAMNIWLLAGEFTLSGAKQLMFNKFLRILMYAYIGAVVIYEQKFFVAIVFYGPAVVAYLAIMLVRWVKFKENIHVWAVAGMAVTIVATLFQSFEIGIHPVYFNHSSLYHVVELPGIYLLYRHAKEVINWMPNP